MSQEGVEVVRRAYEVFDSDLDPLLRVAGPGNEWPSAGVGAGSGGLRPSDAIEPALRSGHKGVRDAFAATAMAWDEPTHTPEDFIDAHDKVLVTVTFRGHGRGSGMEAERPEFHIWTVRGGAIVRFQWFYQRREAFESAGLP